MQMRRENPRFSLDLQACSFALSAPVRSGALEGRPRPVAGPAADGLTHQHHTSR